MHTQNVNVKTATPESSERWGADSVKRRVHVITEQKAYLSELGELNSQQLSEIEEVESLYGILSLMAKNVIDCGTTSWGYATYPRVDFSVAQPWLQAKARAVQLYGDTGREA